MGLLFLKYVDLLKGNENVVKIYKLIVEFFNRRRYFVGIFSVFV